MVFLESQSEEGRPHQLIRGAQMESSQKIPRPLARIITCGRLGIEVLHAVHVGEGDHLELVYGPPEATLLAKKGTSTAFLLLALLASQPGCFASKDWLSEKLGHWREGENEEEEECDGLKRVDNVVSHLRHLLYPSRPNEAPEDKLMRRRLVAYQRASGESGPGYQLAGAPLLWLDVEEISEHVKRARRLKQFGTDGLAEWRAAYDLAMQGSFLPQEIYSDWAQWRRHEREAHLWDSVQALRHRYVELGDGGETEALCVLRDYWLRHPTKEDALRPLLELLGKREQFGQAEEYYEQLCTVLAQEGKQPDQRTQEVMDFLRAARIQRLQTITNTGDSLRLSSVPPLHPSHLQDGTRLPFPHVVPQGIMEAINKSKEISQSLGIQAVDSSRRDFLHAFGALGVDLFISPQLQHWQQILTEKHVPEFPRASVTNLATITQQYRLMQLQGNVFIVEGVRAHLQMIQEALEQTTDDKVRSELWRVLAQTQIVAAFNPVKKVERGRKQTFLELAITSAQQSGDVSLIGAALGHLAQFSLREEQNVIKAMQLLSRAQEYAQAPHPLCGWFALVMAAIAAKMGNRQQCEASLTDAITVAHHLPRTPQYADLYLTDFSLISAQVLTIHCWLTIGNATKAYTHLTEINVEELADNRQASAYCDASRACAMMGEYEQAQQYAFRAIEKAVSTQQHYVIPRSLTVAQTLQQRAPHNSYAAAIVDYAHLALQHSKGECR